MNKKKLVLASIIGITSLTFGAVVLGTVSWFQTMISIPKVKINGNSAGAYFAYGNGSERPVDPDSKDKPYGISHPRHLYNLAWLQYMGFFADGQYYFELADSIPETGLDMTGWILPPIGTESNPFVGNFNGNGKIIKNLTISNDEDTLFDVNNKHPNDISYTAPEIVGLFGVVGNLDGAYTGTYVTETNSIDNLGLSNITIDTQTSHSLAGIVAGYSSGDINNVSVNNSKIDVASGTGCLTNGPTSNISDHGVVGFTTDTSKITNKSQSIYSVGETQDINFNASDTGEDTGWGGSIDMKTVHAKLNDIRTNYSKQTTVYTKKTYHYLDGEIMQGYPTNTTTNTENYRTYADDYKGLGNYSYNEKMGSYIYYDFDHATTTTSQAVLYMGGGHNSDQVEYESYTHTGQVITDGNSHYLNFYLNENDVPLLNEGNSEDDAVRWVIPQSSGRITTQLNGTTYYLTSENNKLAITTTQADGISWSVSRNNGIMSITSGTYHILYEDGWKMRDFNITSETYYYIHDQNNHYMSMGSSAYHLAAVNGSTNAIKWYYDSNYRAYYYLREGMARYLMYYSNPYVIANATASASSSFYRLSSGNISGTSTLYTSSDSYYVRYNSNADDGWGRTSRSNQATQITIDANTIYYTNVDNIQDVQTTTKTGPDYAQSSSQSNVYRYDSQDTTYFPLNSYKENTVDEQGVQHYKHEATDINTGYIMGGGSTNTRFGKYELGASSKYYIQNDDGQGINATNRLKDVHTYNDYGDVVIDSNTTGAPKSSDFEKYLDSKEQISNVLSGSDDGKFTYDQYVYGLHFMDSTISKDQCVKAKYALINGTVYNDYEMPANAIDFRLKEKGYINFFAGSYGRTVNNNTTVDLTPDCFFSLHMIERSGNEITAIKEIEEVWSDGNPKHSYVYKIKNGGYTTPYSFSTEDQRIKYVLDSQDVEGGPYLITDTTHGGYSDGQYHELNSKPSGYTTCKFKTDWITNTDNSYTRYRAYYFEIPMNEGEFCLGTVPGANFGAYLIYLDIGANAAKTNRTQFVEKFHIDTIQYEYPNGIQVTTPGTNPITNADTIAAAIIAGFSGEFELIRNGADVTLKGASNSESKIVPKYRGPLITLVHASGSSTDIGAVPKISESKDVLRLQFYDYNVLMNETVHTIITDESTDNWATKTRTIQQWKVNDNGTETPVATPKIYRSINGVLYKGDEINDLTFSNDSSTVLITFEYEAFNLTINIDEQMLAIVDSGNTNGKFYTFNGYNIQFTVTGGTLTVTVTSIGSEPITINGQTVDNDHLVFQIPLP